VRRTPHPFVYTVLYLPFGALGGFISVALTFLATRHGLSITEGSLLNGAQMLTAWLKWLWAPIVDVTWTPRRWYVFSTAASALGVLAMSVIPLGPDTLWLLLAVIAVASLINSMVGMSIEAIMAEVTPPEEQGRVGAWFQAGNLGGAGFGGGLGLTLLTNLSEPWMAGAIMAGTFLACCLALPFVPHVTGHKHEGGALASVKGVVSDLRELLSSRGGRLAALLCFVPISTGAAQGVLTQATVAAQWGAGETQVSWVQGYTAGAFTVLGCFIGGWLCDRFHPRVAYAGIGVGMALIAFGMAALPSTVEVYVAGNIVYALVVGMAYAGFTAFVLNAMGKGAGATKYNIYASLSNFPIWWLGLVLGRVADVSGPSAMLAAEGAFGLLGVLVFALAVRFTPERLAEKAA
jgi:MFS transporter, PAT family, beta-lactamase induction signal transducer AmpG